MLNLMFGEVYTDWEKNLAVQRELKGLPDERGGFRRFLEGRDRMFTREEIRIAFSNQGMSPSWGFDEEFVIEDPAQYEGRPFRDTGRRAGYDSEIMILARKGPRSFSFFWRPYFTQKYGMISGRVIEEKRQREPGINIIRTTDMNESDSLVEQGWGLVNAVPIKVTETCTAARNPIDWSECEVDRTLFTLSRK